MWQQHGRQGCRGVTLIEAMVVLALLGIMAAIAVPQFRTVWANARVDGNASQLTEFFGLARATAITERTNIRVTPVADGWEISRPVPGGGWQVFKRFRYPDADNVVETRTTNPAGMVSFQYSAMGFFQSVNGGVTAPVQLEVELCSSGSTEERGRTVEVRRTGQVLARKPTNPCPGSTVH